MLPFLGVKYIIPISFCTTLFDQRFKPPSAVPIAKPLQSCLPQLPSLLIKIRQLGTSLMPR